MMRAQLHSREQKLENVQYPTFNVQRRKGKSVSWKVGALLCVAMVWMGAALQAAEVVMEPNLLTLKNGDVLRGKMVSFDPGSGLGWTRSDSIGTMLFEAAKVQTIELGPVKSVAVSGTMPARLRLANGDTLDGNIVALETNALKFDSVCAGPITIPRELLRSISPQSADLKTVFDGITGTNGWTFADVTSAGEDAGYWSYQPGAFVATKSASVARDLKLPDQVTMEFDVSWRGTLNLAIAVYTDSLTPISLRAKEDEPPFAAFYSLQINTHSVNLLYVSQPEPLRNLGQIIAPILGQKNEAHITIHASKERRVLTLLIDGVLVKEWSSGVPAAQGSGVRFVHQGQGSIQMSNLRVREWDGRLDEVSPTAHVGPDEAVITVSGEKLVGKLESYDPAELQLLTGQTPFKVGLKRVQRIEFSPVKVPATAPVSNGRLARAKLANGGVITFVLRSWKDGQATVVLPGIGEVLIKTELLQQLEFLDEPAKSGG